MVFNVNRRLTGGGHRNDISPQLRHVDTSGQPPVLSRGVVVEVISDVRSLNSEELDTIAASVSNPELLDVAPPGSVVARQISDQQERSMTKAIILFPFFSSHFQLPIKAGEQVWIMFEDQQALGYKVGYWLTRPHEWDSVEDVNFTHGDRRFDGTFYPENFRVVERSQQQESPPPGFINGAGSPETFSLLANTTDVNRNPFDTIHETSNARQMTTLEPVPRRRKRPGELLIQGSNNSSVCFGEDRVGGLERREEEVSGSAGVIDLVAGLGRAPAASPDDEAEGNGCDVVQNTRGLLEADRAPFRRYRAGNPNEGDVDFREDASRIYIAQQSRCDENFRITELPWPEKVISWSEQPQPVGSKNRGYVVSKSDHIRVIARKDEEVEGSILLVKEGGDEDLAFFLMTPEGRIQLQGSQIFIGRSTDGSQEPTLGDVSAGPEPWLKYTKIREAGESIADTIKNLKDDMRAEVQKIRDEVAQTLQQAATALQSSTCTPYGPDTGAVAAATILLSGQQRIRLANQEKIPQTNKNVNDGNSTTLNKIDEARSTKIFGE